MKTKNKAPELSGKIEVAEDLDKTEKNIKEKSNSYLCNCINAGICRIFKLYY